MTVINRQKTGGAWTYDGSGLTYDEATDSSSGLPVYYESIGLVSTFTNRDKNAASLGRRAKSGTGWDYDQSPITYDGATDPISGLAVNYDSLGTATNITNRDKNSA